MPSEGGYLEAEGLEKTWRIKQETISHEVDILSRRNQHDIILPGCFLCYYALFCYVYFEDTISLEILVMKFVTLFLLLIVFLLLIFGL